MQSHVAEEATEAYNAKSVLLSAKWNRSYPFADTLAIAARTYSLRDPDLVIFGLRTFPHHNMTHYDIFDSLRHPGTNSVGPTSLRRPSTYTSAVSS